LCAGFGVLFLACALGIIGPLATFALGFGLIVFGAMLAIIDEVREHLA
jgi:hypothetical protein